MLFCEQKGEKGRLKTVKTELTFYGMFWLFVTLAHERSGKKRGEEFRVGALVWTSGLRMIRSDGGRVVMVGRPYLLTAMSCNSDRGRASGRANTCYLHCTARTNCTYP